MITDRQDPSVFQANRIGAVACAICKQVHIDMLDPEGNIAASASITFPQWWQMVVEVGEALEEIEGKPVNGTG
jgi:hypothetical protein